MWHQLIYRFEKFSVHSKYSRAKVFGTILCLGGAIAMSFSMNPPSEPDSTLKLTSRSVSKEWILGCLFLLFAIIILSSNTVLLVCIFCMQARTHARTLYSSCAHRSITLLYLWTIQAATMVNFPAPLTLCAVTSLMGSIFIAIVQFVLDGNLNFGSSSLSLMTLATIVTVVCALSKFYIQKEKKKKD